LTFGLILADMRVVGLTVCSQAGAPSKLGASYG
jgi:hypothetical protein